MNQNEKYARYAIIKQNIFTDNQSCFVCNTDLKAYKQSIPVCICSNCMTVLCPSCMYQNEACHQCNMPKCNFQIQYFENKCNKITLNMHLNLNNDRIYNKNTRKRPHHFTEVDTMNWCYMSTDFCMTSNIRNYIENNYNTDKIIHE